MNQKSEGISEDYQVEIENALEKVINTPIGSKSIDSIVIDVDVPETVEQLLEYAKHETSTEYRQDIKIYEDSNDVSFDYLYNNESVSKEAGTDQLETASYSLTVQENITIEKAETAIADAIMMNTFGIGDASLNLTLEDRERIKNFKEQNQQEWFAMYHNAAWCVRSF